MKSVTQDRSVPFFNYPHVFVSDEEAYTKIFHEVGRRGAFIEQKELKSFEQNLRNYTSAKYALGVANGTDALIIALRAAGIGQGDEVIFSSHTFVATASAIYLVGATPVPVECGPDHMIDAKAVAAAVTKKTKAIMPTQLNGRTCDMDALQAIATKHNLVIVEDAAQGLGSKFKGKDAGTFGAAGTFSFYPAKNLGCLGDGGAIVTNDDRMYEQMHLMHDHGRRASDGEVVMFAYNSRLDNLQAAFLDYKLAKYDQIVTHRRHLAGLYQEYLGGLSEVTLPPAPDSDPRHFDVYQNYEIEADRRDELKAYLKEKGVGTLQQWGGKAVHQFSELKLNVSLPYTEKMFTRLLMVPMNNSLTDADVEYVAHHIRKFYRG